MSLQRKNFALSAIVIVVVAAAMFLLIFKNPTPLREVPAAELTQRNGLSYWKDESIPFTGAIFELYPDGSRKSRSVLSNGLLHGISEGWYTNETLQVREHFREGVSHGLREKWYPTRSKLSEATIVSGQLHGAFRRWHENGSLAEEIFMSNGNPDGTSKAYHPDGSLKAIATFEYGKVIEQKFWQSGESKEKPAVSSGVDAPRL